MKIFNILKSIPIAFIALSGSVETGFTQDRNQSWQFTGQNRASIAALIRDVEKNSSRGNTVVSAVPSSAYTNLVCGKDGQTSASGNTTCIILNNSDGTIDVGQESDGSQSASTTTTTTQSSVDEVLDVLTTQN